MAHLDVRDASGDRRVAIEPVPFCIGRRETNQLRLTDDVITAVRAFTAGAAQSDDITAMVVRYRGAGN